MKKLMLIMAMAIGLVACHDEKIDLTGKGDGGDKEAVRLGVPMLGKIPLDIRTREGGDQGKPVALEDTGSNRVAAAFEGLAQTLASTLGE